MTTEEMRERAAKIARNNLNWKTAEEILAIPIPPKPTKRMIYTVEKGANMLPNLSVTPPDPSAEALKLAEEALGVIAKTENNVARSSMREFASERLAAIRKITGGV